MHSRHRSEPTSAVPIAFPAVGTPAGKSIERQVGAQPLARDIGAAVSRFASVQLSPMMASLLPHAGALRLLAYDNKLAIPSVDPQAVPPQGQPEGKVFFVDGNGLSPVRTPLKS